MLLLLPGCGGVDADGEGGQTLVRLKMRNLLTRRSSTRRSRHRRSSRSRTETVEASYLYSDGEGSYFLDQETFDTLRLTAA